MKNGTSHLRVLSSHSGQMARHPCSSKLRMDPTPAWPASCETPGRGHPASQGLCGAYCVPDFHPDGTCAFLGGVLAWCPRVSIPTVSRASKSPGSVQGQLSPSQEGLASFTAVNQDPGAEACRWNVGADFPEPSFKMDLNCQSYYKSESRLLDRIWTGSAGVGSTTGALPRDFHCLDFCARLECFLCCLGSFQSSEARYRFLAQNWKEEVMTHIRDKNACPATTLFPACLSLQRPSF